jgi:hypothetical protein
MYVCKHTLNTFNIEKSSIDAVADFKDTLPEKKTSAMMEEIADFQWMVLLLNLASFRANQIAFTELMTADYIEETKLYSPRSRNHRWNV